MILDQIRKTKEILQYKSLEDYAFIKIVENRDKKKNFRLNNKKDYEKPWIL